MELYFWLLGPAIWGLYDLWAIIFRRRTLSQWVWRVSKTKPAVPFFFGLSMGLLGGHLFL